MSSMMHNFVSLPPPASRQVAVKRETAEDAVRQVVANGRLEGAPDPDADELEELLAVARGERSADEVIASFGQRYG